MTEDLHDLADETLDSLVTTHSTLLTALDCGADTRAAIRVAYGWDLELVDPQMALAQIDQIVIRRLNDFPTERPAPMILDCGANIGISALNYKRRFPDARIVAFEPDPMICGVLRRNLSRNGAEDVQVVEAAVWTSSGQMPFKSTGTDGGRIDSSRGSKVPRVATVDLRSYLAEPVDLLKLDIEGAEYAVVHALRRRLQNVANLIVECHLHQGSFGQFNQLLGDLQDHGFEVSINTFGKWRDLIRRSSVVPPYSEQYLALYAWRPDAPVPSNVSSYLPYVDLSMLLDLSRTYARNGALRHYQNALSAETVANLLESAVRLQGPYVSNDDFCWVADVPDAIPPGDTDEQPMRSTLILFEDGKPIGPAHTQHALIRRFGAGRYSHWHNRLFFSTSDDSDPNSNDRCYSVAVSDSEADS